MDTKLTLKPDKEVKSLSALTEELYKNSSDDSESENLSPIAKKYKGIISNPDFGADAAKFTYLKDKHLL